MCLSLGAPLPDLLSPITLDGWRLTIGCNTPSSTLLRHPPMVMNSWVPILVGDAAHAALLLDMGTQEPKVTEYLPIDRQGGNMGSPGTRLLTSQEAVMAAQLGVPEAVPMTQGRHLLVAPKVPDAVGVRHLAPDAGDEQDPACHPALVAMRPLLQVGWVIPFLSISWASKLGYPNAMRVSLTLLCLKIGSPCCWVSSESISWMS